MNKFRVKLDVVVDGFSQSQVEELYSVRESENDVKRLKVEEIE